MTTILIADDHEMILEGMRRILQGSDFQIVGSANNGRDLVTAAAQARPDIIVADFSMPFLNGVEVTRELRKQEIHSKVILVTMHDEVTFLQEALAAGVSGYVLKSDGARELTTAIRMVTAGEVYIPSSMAEAVQAPHHQVVLTERQVEILKLISQGISMKEIAAQVHLSVRTVEFHKYRVMQALQVQNSVELVRYALQHGLVG